MTREEHVAAAEAIARDNPGWTWEAETCYLTHDDSEAMVTLLNDGTWDAWVDSCWWLHPDGDTEAFLYFPTAAVAIEALGFTLAHGAPSSNGQDT